MVYLPTFTTEINHSCHGKDAVCPMGGMYKNKISEILRFQCAYHDLFFCAYLTK